MPCYDNWEYEGNGYYGNNKYNMYKLYLDHHGEPDHWELKPIPFNPTTTTMSATTMGTNVEHPNTRLQGKNTRVRELDMSQGMRHMSTESSTMRTGSLRAVNVKYTSMKSLYMMTMSYVSSKSSNRCPTRRDMNPRCLNITTAC